MNKIISFSLWGSNPKYNVGAIKNAQLAKTIYPNWKCRFYTADSVPEKYISDLLSFDHVEIIKNHKSSDGWQNAFWRYAASWDDSVDITIFRDADSRLNEREKTAVDFWLSSSKTFHIMRDHPFHKFHMLGGMWGYKKNKTYDMKNIFNSFVPQNNYFTEYEFFRTILFDIIEDDKITHDEFFENKPFPTKRINNEFVGEIYDEENNRHPDHYKYITS